MQCGSTTTHPAAMPKRDGTTSIFLGGSAIHADQDRFSMPRLDPSCTFGIGSSTIPGFSPTGRQERRSGMALLLLQRPHDRGGIVSGARYFHPTNEAEKYASLDAR